MWLLEYVQNRFVKDVGVFVKTILMKICYLGNLVPVAIKLVITIYNDAAKKCVFLEKL